MSPSLNQRVLRLQQSIQNARGGVSSFGALKALITPIANCVLEALENPDHPLCMELDEFKSIVAHNGLEIDEIFLINPGSSVVLEMPSGNARIHLYQERWKLQLLIIVVGLSGNSALLDELLELPHGRSRAAANNVVTTRSIFRLGDALPSLLCEALQRCITREPEPEEHTKNAGPPASAPAEERSDPAVLEGRVLEWGRKKLSLSKHRAIFIRLLFDAKGKVVKDRTFKDAGISCPKDTLNKLLKLLQRESARPPFKISRVRGEGYVLTFEQPS